mgnify:CR=1 FL=1|jgi:glycosyltransferase involved in cell wall biosynthesis
MSENLIVIPAYNEFSCLEKNINLLYNFIKKEDLNSDIVISDNNSTDGTKEIAQDRAYRFDNIFYNLVLEKGKGNTVIKTWLDKRFDNYLTYSFMDADLATDLESLPHLLDDLEAGYDIVVGSRYLDNSVVERSLKRTMLSKGYKKLFHLFFPMSINDIQCGFKGINNYTRDTLLHNINNKGFFFDSELLVKAYYNGYQIKEIPVNWHEGKKTSVSIKDPFLFIKELISLKYSQMTNNLKI